MRHCETHRHQSGHKKWNRDEEWCHLCVRYVTGLERHTQRKELSN